MISQSLNDSIIHFTRVNIESIDQMKSVITEKIWSPIIWAKNYRIGKEFAGCRYVVIDCDNGKTSLEKAIEICQRENWMHIIGTTKSHQMEKILPSGKVKKACDRYRVVLFADSYTKCGNDYKETIKRYMSLFDGDSACTDLARYFNPCNDIMSANDKGVYLKWEKYTPKKYKPRKITKSKKIPDKVIQYLLGKKIVRDSRHVTVFTVAAELTRCGFDSNAVLNIAAKSPLVRELLVEFGNEYFNEIERQVMNGCKTAEREIGVDGSK